MRELHVVLTPGETVPMVEGQLYPAGDDHVWIVVDFLKDLGPVSSDWTEDFDAMIAKAAQYGWVSEDGLRVRAHVKRLPDSISGDVGPA